MSPRTASVVVLTDAVRSTPPAFTINDLTGMVIHGCDSWTPTDSLNPIIYAELSLAFGRVEDLDTAIAELELRFLELPRAALYLAGKAFVRYRKRGGSMTNVLSDFFIGAHAAVTECTILTRDTKRYRGYFPTVRLIAPT